ncbi:type VI secretion system Vgr family protein [Citrobacter portucalensis]|uniref:type VI secretion system Vgr family protein n=1 Tax=Citrobacter portucalensis TaxID=1639133 RepID=UPI002B23E64A|nr:type VI secretion system tip protein VgrG [Citrobacter portucalensis]MEB0326070.1 type VI secretion system tip protein TssI/VgrG [Citrobacter portucalensis]MEB0358345.1 type VI secretion system tip protein TssI/VgrG [Citrobacter portucalensis]MEB0403662.1 type VI secretion system tip protein TssI/VgrG [Citrobacter portucalensis]UDR02459.1 type VI secretion system tip protein VgrG [Citrobacter freundii]
MSLKGLRFTLDVDGQDAGTFAVVNFWLMQNNSVPFVLDVDVASDEFDREAKNLLEKNATLTIWQGPKALRYVKGVVASFGMKENNRWQMLYRFRIQPPLWRSTLRQNFRIFQQQDIRTISATLLDENGVTDWTSSFNTDHPPREFCVQYGESDLAFLSRLWAEEGIFFYDKLAPDSPDQKLTLCDDVAGLSPLKEAITFNPNTTTEVADECISTFHYEANVRPSSVMSKDYTFKTPGWEGKFNQQGENLNSQFTQYEIYDYPGRFKDEQHGQDFTRYQMDGLRNNAERASGSSNSPKLWPGTRFTLKSHPQKSLNREWQVVSSTLVGQQPQALKGNQGYGTILHNRFIAIPADRTWRPQPSSKPRVDGPQSAIVTGPTGEEIFCDNHGRVRVKFHWDRNRPKSSEDTSCWVRVSQAWAGSGFGNLAIPRIGQEVIVDFLNGDPDQPIIMGRTYHQDNRSPGDLPGTKTQMTIRSKTYKGEGFNELRFDDATDKEQVYIHAQKNMDTEVLNDRSTTVNHDHNETVKNNQTVTVGVGQTVNVGSKKEGGHDQKVTVANDQTITVQNNQKLEVTKDREKNIGGNQTTTITGQDTETVTEDQNVTVKKSYKLDVADDTKIISGKSIELICGPCSIKMEQSGTVTITGLKFNFTANGPVEIKGEDVDIN